MPHTPWSQLTPEQRAEHTRKRRDRKRAQREREKCRSGGRLRFLPMSREAALAIYQQIKAERLQREAAGE